MRKAFCWKDERLELEKLSKNFFLNLELLRFLSLMFPFTCPCCIQINELTCIPTDISVQMNVLLNYGLFLSMSDFGEIMEIGICCSSFGSVVIASSLALSNTVAVLELQLSRCCQFFAATLEGSSRLIMRVSHSVFLLSSCHLVAKCGRL